MARDRDKAPNLFVDELEEPLETLLILPESGKLYGTHDAVVLRRVRLRKARCHLYHSVEGDEIVVHFVWGARMRSGPPLSSAGL